MASPREGTIEDDANNPGENNLESYKTTGIWKTCKTIRKSIIIATKKINPNHFLLKSKLKYI